MSGFLLPGTLTAATSGKRLHALPGGKSGPLEGDRMAEKYAILIKYKYLEYIESAKLSDADAWLLMKGAIEYDKTGIEPVYTNPILQGLFAVIKIDLDQNRKNYEAVSEERSKAGKEGAKKRWGNRENSNCQENIAKIGIANDSNCQENQKIMAKMHDNDLDLDSENSIIIADACASAIAANILNLQNECERLGFKISQRRAKTLLRDYASGFKNPAGTGVYETLYGPDGFTEYVSTYVHEHKDYRHKPQEEKLKLFLSLMVSADIYNEYVGSNP
jgi:hypothetical protein